MKGDAYVNLDEHADEDRVKDGDVDTNEGGGGRIVCKFRCEADEEKNRDKDVDANVDVICM